MRFFQAIMILNFKTYLYNIICNILRKEDNCNNNRNKYSMGNLHKVRILRDFKNKIAFLIIVSVVHFLLSAALLKQASSYPVISIPQNFSSPSILEKLSAYKYRLGKIIKNRENYRKENYRKENKKIDVLKKHHKHLKIFKEGYKFYKNGNYRKAAGFFWLYTAKKGMFLYDYSLYYQGVCFIKTHKYHKADFVLSKLAMDYPHFIFYKNAIFYLAVAMYKTGYYNGAAYNFKRLLKITEDNRIRPYSYEKIADIYLIKHNYKKAEAALAEIYVNYPYYYKTRHVFNLLAKIKNFKKFGGNGYNGFALTQNQEVKRALNLYYDSYFKESEQTIANVKGNRAEIIRLKDMLKLKSPQFLNQLAIFKSDIKKEFKKFKSKTEAKHIKHIKHIKYKYSGNSQKTNSYGRNLSKYLHEISYLKADYFYLNANVHNTVKYLNKIFYKYGYLNKKETDIYQNVVWRRVLNNLKRNELVEARKKLLQLIKISPKSPNYPKYLFWYGIDLKKLDLTAHANFYFEMANAVAPLSYYGIMSGVELGHVLNFEKAHLQLTQARLNLNQRHLKLSQSQSRLNVSKRHLNPSKRQLKSTRYPSKGHLKSTRYPSKGQLKSTRLKLKDSGGGADAETGYKFYKNFSNMRSYYVLKTFLKLNLFALAQYKLNEILKFNQIKDNKYFILKLINLFSRYKDYKDAASLSDLLIKSKFLSRKYLYFLYPRPYYGYAEKYSERYNVPVNLIYSIMRQESLFDPVCSSGAGAIGLMQIISPTGYYIANKVGCAYFNPDYLYQSSLNIKFGSYYLSSLLNEFARKKYLAIASYNAGPGAVSYWKNNNLSDENRLLFIENIPYNQTRNYVKMVLRNYYVYNALYKK